MQKTHANEQERTLENCAVFSGPFTSLKNCEQLKCFYTDVKISPGYFFFEKAFLKEVLHYMFVFPAP